MDVTDILPQLDRLDGDIDNLEEVLKPLIGSLADVASKLPLLDKAKLYVLVTYSIESMLFSALRLNGVDAKEHQIFKELARVRQYFEKIKNIETPPEKPNQSLNKEAAIRFIRADLADDKQINTKLSEMIAKERAKAALKTAQARAKAGEKRKVSDENDSSSSSDSESEAETNAEAQKTSGKTPVGGGERKKKKKKSDKKTKAKAEAVAEEASVETAKGDDTEKRKKKGTKQEGAEKRKNKKKRKGDE